MNVYCVKCGGEMEIMRDLGSELRVYPCGCGGNGRRNAAQHSVQRMGLDVYMDKELAEELVKRGYEGKLTPRR